MNRAQAPVPSPYGTFWLVAGGEGVEEVRFPQEGPREDLPHSGFPEWQATLSAFLQGRLRLPSLPLAAPEEGPLARAVFAVLAGTREGQTVTYGELATRSGAAGAARAVGRILSQNPLPLLRPCHRVVGATGLGGYRGGLPLKSDLLRQEAALARTFDSNPANWQILPGQTAIEMLY